MRMTNEAVSRRALLWGFYVVLVVWAMADPQLVDAPVLTLASTAVTWYDLALLVAGVLGLVPLLDLAASPERGVTRTVARLVVAYLAYQVMVVIPVAVLTGTASLAGVFRGMSVRFTWLLLPTVVALMRDERARRSAGQVALAGAVLLAAYGAIVALAGGGGWYFDGGELRYRILWGGASVLFFWPIATALSGESVRARDILLIMVGLAGIALTNHRSGILVLAIGGMVLLLHREKRGPALVWLTGGALGMGVLALAWGAELSRVFGYTLARLLEFSTGNGADRLLRWGLSWEFFTSRPFGDFVWSWRYYLVDLADPHGPHNLVLDIATIEGVVGLAFYGPLIWIVLSYAWPQMKHSPRIRALGAFLIMYLGFGLLNATFYALACMPLFVAAVAATAVFVDVEGDGVSRVFSSGAGAS